MKRLGFILALVMLGVLLASCARETGEGEETGFAGPIRIGLTIDDTNPQRGEEASREMARALEAFLGIPVVAYNDINYIVGTEAMRGGHLDIMLVSAFNYIHTSAAVDVEMLVSLPIRAGTVNNAVFVVCASSDIYTLEDMRGRTVVFVSPTSTTGFIFPVYLLVNEMGVNPDLITNSGYFFSDVMFVNSHPLNILSVGLGDVDIAGVGGMFLEHMEEQGQIDLADFRVIAASAPVPNPSYIIRAALDDELIERIREFFLTFDEDAYFAENWGDGSIRFSPPEVEGFAYVRSVVSALGLDLN